MWLHGSVSMFVGEHPMEGPSCFEQCLSSLHLNTADEGLVVSGAMAAFPSRTDEREIDPVATASVRTAGESHHDPGRLLTIIKRE